MASLSPMPFSTHQSIRPSVTFVLHDAGETKALTPVMQQLDANCVSYSVIAEDTAQQLLTNNPHVVLPPQDIQKLASSNPNLASFLQQKWNQALQANCCVTGLVSNFQKLWADFFKQAGRRVIGYYDGFSFSTSSQQNPACAFVGSLTDLITPSRDATFYFRDHGFSDIPVSAQGQPVLESTAWRLQQTNATEISQSLGLNPNQPTLLWVGQYGEPYEKAFSLFCQAATQCPQANYLVALHPHADGIVEQQILQAFGLQNRIQILPKTISTEQALPIANVVFSYNSTMATQAFLQGRPVILVGTDNADRFDPLRAYHLVPQCNTRDMLANAIKQATSSNQPLQPPLEPYSLLGIPYQATLNITNYILRACGMPEMNDTRTGITEC